MFLNRIKRRWSWLHFSVYMEVHMCACGQRSTRVISQLSSLFVCAWHSVSLPWSALMRLLWLASEAQATDFLLLNTEITADATIGSFSPCFTEPSPPNHPIGLVSYHRIRDVKQKSGLAGLVSILQSLHHRQHCFHVMDEACTQTYRSAEQVTCSLPQ